MNIKIKLILMDGPKVKNAQLFLQTSLALVKPNYMLETPQKFINTRLK